MRSTGFVYTGVVLLPWCKPSPLGGGFSGMRLRVNYTSYASSLQVGGRGRPGWPRQTRFWGRAGSGLSTPGTWRHLRREGGEYFRESWVKRFLNPRQATVITDFFGHGQSLGVRDGGEFLLPQLLYGLFVIPQIQLGAHQDDGSVGTMMSHLRIPLQSQSSQ